MTGRERRYPSSPLPQGFAYKLYFTADAGIALSVTNYILCGKTGNHSILAVSGERHLQTLFADYSGGLARDGVV
jgi:hypothetical protein